MVAIESSKQLNKAFENRIKLGIMAHLMVNEKESFMNFKKMFDLADGNLATHLNSLDREGHVTIKKKFVGKRPLTTYHLTPKGRKSFSEHIALMEKILKGK